MEDAQFDAAERRHRRRRRAAGARRRPPAAPAADHDRETSRSASFAIVQSFAGHHNRAASGIVLAALADAIDGRVARRAGASSRFGLEYDSIADTVSFAWRPRCSRSRRPPLGARKPGWVMAFTFTVCAALRLARFNVSPGRYKGRFEGMRRPPRR